MIGLIVSLAAVLLTIGAGVKYLNGQREDALAIFKKIVSISVLVLIAGVILTPVTALAESTSGSEVNGNAMIGVALSTGLAALGAGIAVGLTGSAAIGAISEDPRMLGRSLIFVGLAEGVAIYGLVISIMIFGRV